MSTMPQREDARVTNQAVFGLIYILCNAHRLCITVFTRHSFGTNAFDISGLFALFFLLFAAGANLAFRLYFMLWFVALVGHRIQSYRLRWKGEDNHSKYQGYPWLAMRW